MEALIGEDESAVHRDALLFEAEALGHRAAAHGDEEVLGFEFGAVLERDLDAVGGLLDALEHDAELVVDLALLERALEGLRDRLVLVGDKVGQTLDDRDIGAVGLPDAGEFDADDAAAEDDDRLRHGVELERLGAREHPIGDVEAERLRRRPGREQDVLAGEGVRLIGARDLDLVLADELAVTEVGVDAAGLDESLEALVVAVDDVRLVLEHLVDVDALELGVDTERLGLLGRVGDLSSVEECLRRHTSAVQTRSAHLVAFDQSDLHVELCRAQSRGIAAGSAAEDD
ncbi:Uncharacterised protein [Mycobacteroides abscessus subsp. abscessus]|nr:Uncharacterised protein [Mycobacteroides abscessus subsp. abscessus]